jgi:hypothetical protein
LFFVGMALVTVALLLLSLASLPRGQLRGEASDFSAEGMQQQRVQTSAAE